MRTVKNFSVEEIFVIEVNYRFGGKRGPRGGLDDR